jgi:multiple sugar transport system permease protein
MTATMERPTTTVHPRAKRRRLSDGPLSTRIIMTAVLGLIAIYFLVPVYWLIVSATKNSTDLFGSFGLWFAHPQLLTNLGDLFSFDSHIYLRWGLNSIIYAGGGALVATALAAGAGYGLARFSFRGREAVFNTVLAGVMLPQTALALPLYLLFAQAHLANSYWAVLLPSFVSPFGVYLCRIYADASVPPGLLEAARIDGASEFAIFRRIVLRIMSPALVTVFLFQFVGIWNNYFLPLVMLSDTKLYPITLGLTSWQGFASRQPLLYQLEVGGALVSVIPLMILIVVLQRFWRSGLTEGSVKA